MDLGKAKLLRTGLNTLHQAIHPVHGVAWTDGKQVCLTSVFHVNGEVKFGDTNVIGQFEHVFGLFWGPLCCSGSPALLAVQHKKHITVWQLQLSALEQNKLLCTQTCEMSEPFPLLPQGCVWHPKLDILAVLTKNDTSVLFSVRVDNRRVKADIRTSGLIHCACWTRDGTRLVVAIGSALHSFVWNDTHKSLLACSFCPVFDVGGRICALEAAGESQVAAATELPLDKLCGLNAGIAFELPSEPPRNHESSAMLVSNDDGALLDSRRKLFDLDRPSGPLDLTQLLARHRRSDPTPLIHLRRRDTVTGSGQDSSHLVLVAYERKVTTSRRVCIPGILVPDIVAFDSRDSTVAVASNTCNMVLVYCITASAMPNIQQISLQKNERPKGVCFLSDKTLLLMVGRQKSSDPTFLPSSNTDKYILRIVTEHLMHNGDTPAPPSPSPHHPKTSSHFHAGTRRHSEHLSRDDGERLGIKDLVLPGGAVLLRSPGSSRRKLVEEVRSSEPSAVASQVDLADRTSENFDGDHVGRTAGLAMARRASRDSSRASSPHSDPSDNKLHSEAATPMADKRSGPALEQLVQNMDRLLARFSDVQQCMAEIQGFAQNGRKPPGIYPSACEPPYVNVTCQKQLSENVFIDERRPVLLCEGKLSLRALRDLFDLTMVELMHGPLWIVLVADAEGFLPLTFKPHDELTVRNGKRKSPLWTLGSPETAGPPSPVLNQSPN